MTKLTDLKLKYETLKEKLQKSITSGSDNKSLTQLQLDTNDNTQSELKKLDIQVVSNLKAHLDMIETDSSTLHNSVKNLKDKYSSKSVWSGGDDNNAMDELTSQLGVVITRSKNVFFRNDLRDSTFDSSYVSYDTSANSYTDVSGSEAQVHFDSNPNTLPIGKVSINFKVSNFGNKLVTASEYTTAWHNYRSYLNEEWGSTSFQTFLDDKKTNFTSDTATLATADTITFDKDNKEITVSIVGGTPATYAYNSSSKKWEDKTDAMKILKYNDGGGASETWMSKGLYDFFSDANPSTVLDAMYTVVNYAKDDLRFIESSLKTAKSEIDVIADAINLDSLAIVSYELDKEAEVQLNGIDENETDSNA